MLMGRVFMQIELLYLWLVAFPLLGGVFYAWYRVRQSRLTGEPIRWWNAGGSSSVLLTAEAVRWPVVGLLVSGGLLVSLGQGAYRHVPLPQRWVVFALMVLGLLLFLAAGRIARQPQLPQWLLSSLQWAAGRLQVTPGQVPLLLLAPFLGMMALLAAGPLLVARQPLVANAAWLSSIVLALVGSWQLGEPLSLRVTRRDLLLTAVLFSGAFLLRGLFMETIPTTLSGDEGSSGLVAVSFLKGDINNLFSFGWFSFPSFYFAVQSVGIWLMGNTTAALRLTSAVAGALTVTAVYWLGRSMFDRVTGGLAALYLLASHYHIHMSRIGLNNIWDGLFATVAIAGLWHGWRYGRRASFLLSGIAVGLGQYFYVSIRILPLLFMMWGVAALIGERALLRQRFAGLLLSVYVAVIVFLPLAVLFASSPDNFNAPLQRVTIFDGWLEDTMQREEKTAAAIIVGQMATAALGFTHQPLRLLYDPGVPLLLTGAATLFLIGLAWSLLSFDLRYLLLLLPLGAAVVASGFSLDPPASQRYIMSIPLVAIIMALPLGQAVAWLRQLWPSRAKVIVAAAVVVMAWTAVLDVHYYFFKVYDHYVLGGWNTETATDIAAYLREQETRQQHVYFFGVPRMGYYSLSTIPYLVPDMVGEDVIEPLTQPARLSLYGPTLFVFLPERVHELEHVRAVFPGGTYEEFWNERQQYVFSVYSVAP